MKKQRQRNDNRESKMSAGKCLKGSFSACNNIAAETTMSP
jgi:hypothetical protein